jgi:hypothetical protein
LIHLPIHASWLNQIAIYFSILQRKALTPNDFADLNALAARIAAFEATTARWPSRLTGLSPRRPRRALGEADRPRAAAARRRLTLRQSRYAANRTPRGVRATPTRTATAWITLAHNSCRDPLARSISAPTHRLSFPFLELAQFSVPVDTTRDFRRQT